MDLLTWVLFVLGLVLLVVGAEALVTGASRLAFAAGVSPLVIGLTVVAFGTSAPELAVSVRSALASEAGADIAIGNVVGSNIFNVLVILGLSAVVAPLVVSRRLVRQDVPLMIGASVVMLLMTLDGRVGRWEGLVLFLGLLAFTTFTLVQGRKESEEVAQTGPLLGTRGWRTTAWNVVLVVAGLGMLVLGSQWLIDGAVTIARSLGVSELIIGLTLIAAGTSLPELATSVMASLRGARDIAVGNVVGSNLFNILAVLGTTALVAPRGVQVAPAALHFDLPVMLAVAVACLPIFFTGYEISRWEGGVFLGYYAVYAAYLALAASQHDALPVFSDVMLFFVLPLTALTLGITVYRQLRR